MLGTDASVGAFDLQWSEWLLSGAVIVAYDINPIDPPTKASHSSQSKSTLPMRSS
jgi:hypothetical protein